MEEYPLTQSFIEETPMNKEEAYNHWKTLRQTIQLLQITYQNPGDRIEGSLKLAYKSEK